MWAEHRAHVVATLARRLGDLQLAEDAVQEAYLAAARCWPIEGLPHRPGAWLTTTAWRRALDDARQRARLSPAGRSALQAAISCRDRAVGERPSDDGEAAGLDPVAAADDVLALVLACCHPALSPEAQVALTLRHVVGLADREVAGRLLVAAPTMTKRLVRARAKIKQAGIRFEVPTTDHLPGRLHEVRAVVHLIFTQGYGDPEHGGPLCQEAIWLARQLHRMLPADNECTALLSLLLLQHARWPARWVDGKIVPYDQQDRTRWSSPSLHEARKLLAESPVPGPYGLQAAIALLRSDPDREPAWPLIADLYAALARSDDSPVVQVNRAVAVGHADGPHAGLAVLAPLLTDPRVAGTPALLAAHADLLQRAGQPQAGQAWERAARATSNPAERAHLQHRALLARQTGP